MAKISNFLIGLSLIILLILSSIGYPYILPPTQIIEFMTNKFTKIERLKITQLNKIKDLNQEGERVFGEIIYFWFPTLYRSEIAGQLGKRLIIHDGIETLRVIDREITSEGESWDIPYRFLMLTQNPERLLERLKDLGMKLDKASLTRFEGRIAYLIGEKEEGSPKLLVDKDLFVPLLLQYGNILLRFSDYREFMEQNWYPYKIAYSFNGDIIEEYTIKDIIVNPSLDLSLFDIPLISSQFGKSE